jgi:hypothetical protein
MQKLAGKFIIETVAENLCWIFSPGFHHKSGYYHLVSHAIKELWDRKFFVQT